MSAANTGQVFAAGILAAADGGGRSEAQNGNTALVNSSSTGGVFTGTITNSGTITVSATGTGSGNAAGIPRSGFASPRR